MFIDRDGVVNELALNPANGVHESPHRPEDVRLCPGAAAAIARVRREGRAAIVVSNQPSAAKGKCSLDDLGAVHRRVVELLAGEGAEADGFYYCHHHPAGVVPALATRCECRKPAAGLLLRAATEGDLDLAGSWMIGDRASDIECGRRAGCRTIRVENPLTPPETGEAGGFDARPDREAADLKSAIDLIFSEATQHAGR